MAIAVLLGACGGGSDDPPTPGTSATSPPTSVLEPVVGGDDSGTNADDPASQPTEADDPVCDNFRSLVAPNAPCDDIVRTIEPPECSAANGTPVDCSAIPRVARVGEVSGAVLGGQPVRPDIEAVQFGRGPGPTNTSLLLFVGAPLPATTTDQLELAVVFDDPDAEGCEAQGESWDGGSFVSVLRLGPGPTRVTDLGCRPDGFAEISQRSSWLVSGSTVIVHLPVDLPGTPSRVTGTFRAAPDFVFDDGRSITRRLDAGAWSFDEPLDP